MENTGLFDALQKAAAIAKDHGADEKLVPFLLSPMSDHAPAVGHEMAEKSVWLLVAAHFPHSWTSEEKDLYLGGKLGFLVSAFSHGMYASRGHEEPAPTIEFNVHEGGQHMMAIAAKLGLPNDE